jgi:lysophospholipase L1-like esterase
MAAALLAAAPTSAGEVRCTVPAAVAMLGAELPSFRDRIREGGPVIVVTLGSSSTAGAGASSSSATYPSVLAAELRRLWPGVDFQVVNAGIGGQRALDMYRRLDSEVLSLRPALVVWQTGVNDAVHDIGLARFRHIIEKGLGKLFEAGVDVVVMDQQPLPRADRMPQYAAYLEALRQVARENEAALFRRYDVMRWWSETGALASEEIIGPDGIHMVDASYRCLAQVLAGALYDSTETQAPARATQVQAPAQQ